MTHTFILCIYNYRLIKIIGKLACNLEKLILPPDNCFTVKNYVAIAAVGSGEIVRITPTENKQSYVCHFLWNSREQFLLLHLTLYQTLLIWGTSTGVAYQLNIYLIYRCEWIVGTHKRILQWGKTYNKGALNMHRTW